MKKKIIVTMLCGCMLLSVAACSQTTNANAGENSPAPTAKTEAGTTPAADNVTEPDSTSVADNVTTPDSTPVADNTAEPEETTPVQRNVYPLESSTDINSLDNCMLAVSFQKGDVYVDESGKMQLKVMVYTYDTYDMVDISLLAEGDTIMLRGEEVTVTSLVRTESGAVQINGGLDAGGYELITDDSTVYFETGYSDAKAYYELGEVTLPLSEDFLFTDGMNLDADPVTYFLDDFLTEDAGIIYGFTPHNTTITIENGQISSMNRSYAP